MLEIEGRMWLKPVVEDVKLLLSVDRLNETENAFL